MTGLLSSLTQIALLRKDPGSLPSSTASVAFFALLFAATDLAVIWLDVNDRLLARTILDIAVALSFVGVLLTLTGRMHRYAQTVIAIFGTDLLLTPAVIALAAPAVAREVELRGRALFHGRHGAGRRVVPADRRPHPALGARHRPRDRIRDRRHLVVRRPRAVAGLLWRTVLMHLHILGICGTFMGGLAALARAAGHRVTGSDANIYPPMSTQLAAEGIELIDGYDPAQLDLKPDVVVVGNVMTRGKPIIERLLDSGMRVRLGPAMARRERAARARGRGRRGHARQDDDLVHARLDPAGRGARSGFPDRRHPGELRCDRAGRAGARCS